MCNGFQLPQFPGWDASRTHGRQPHACPGRTLAQLRAAPGPDRPLLSRWVLAILSLSQSASTSSSSSSDASRSWRGFGLVGPTVVHPSRALPCCLSRGFSSPLRGLQWRGELVFGTLLAGGTLILKIFSPPHLRLGSISPIGLLVGFAREMRLCLL